MQGINFIVMDSPFQFSGIICGSEHIPRSLYKTKVAACGMEDKSYCIKAVLYGLTNHTAQLNASDTHHLNERTV